MPRCRGGRRSDDSAAIERTGVPGKPIVSRKRVTTRRFARHQNQVLIAHQLADRGRHLGHQPRRERRQDIAIDFV